MDVQLSGSSVAGQLFLDPGKGITLGSGCAAQLSVEGRVAVLRALKLHLAVSALSPRESLWLVDLSYRLPYSDPGGVVGCGGTAACPGLPGSLPELAQNRDCAAVCSNNVKALSESDCWCA